MKRIIPFWLLILCCLTGCADDKDTIVYFSHEINATLPNCVLGYEKDGQWIRLASLGDLPQGKRSKEFTVTDESIGEIYFFTDYGSTTIDGSKYASRVSDPYVLDKGESNHFSLWPVTAFRTVAVDDPAQYPR